jgi:hypothetical protein
MLATPELSVGKWAKALNDLSALFSAVQSQTGDLSFQIVNDIQRRRAEVERAYLDIVADAQIAPTLIAANVSDRGGPSTNAETASSHQALMAALDAWEPVVLVAARAPTKAAIVGVSSRNLNGVDLKQIEMASSIPATFADPIRTGAEANAVASALAALGA